MSYVADEVRGSFGAFDLQSPCGDPGCAAQVVQVRAIHFLQETQASIRVSSLVTPKHD